MKGSSCVPRLSLVLFPLWLFKAPLFFGSTYVRRMHARTCMHTCTHTHARTHARTHTRTHARTHTRTRTHAHARTHTHAIIYPMVHVRANLICCLDPFPKSQGTESAPSWRMHKPCMSLTGTNHRQMSLTGTNHRQTHVLSGRDSNVQTRLRVLTIVHNYSPGFVALPGVCRHLELSK